MADLEAFKIAFGQLLRGKTDAASRVSTSLPEKPTLPAITFQIRGATPWEGWHNGERVRVQATFWGRTEQEADRLYSQVRGVLLPVDTPVEGYAGREVVVVDGGVSPRVVNFSGAALNGGPNGMVDAPTGLPIAEAYFLVDYW